MIETKAVHKNMRLSCQKARLVLNRIRGLHINEAKNTLAFGTNKASRLIMEVLNSSIANATHNAKLEVDNLYINTAFADAGTTLKRRRAGSRGQAKPILKRTAHITIRVGTR